MPPIELRTPTSFLFFVASTYIARETLAVKELGWFACAAFCFFIMLGPLVWLDRSPSNGNGMMPIGGLVRSPEVLRALIWYGQAIALMVGLVSTWFGLAAVAF